MKSEMNSGEICWLDTLKIGQSAKVMNIKIMDKSKKRHLLDMGITRGVIIQIKKIAPLGDPIDIKLRDYELCLRKEDLKHIQVQVLWTNK